jgi:hypothetical protein
VPPLAVQTPPRAVQSAPRMVQMTPRTVQTLLQAVQALQWAVQVRINRVEMPRDLVQVFSNRVQTLSDLIKPPLGPKAKKSFPPAVRCGGKPQRGSISKAWGSREARAATQEDQPGVPNPERVLSPGRCGNDATRSGLRILRHLILG